MDNLHNISDLIMPGTRDSGNSSLLINIFGGPGTGKSTLASNIFSDLKRNHIEAVCPEEHAKIAIWSGQPWILDQQVILLGRTWETICALHDKVDVIVIDSPLLLCSIYAGDNEPTSFHDLVVDLHRRAKRLNIFLDRHPESPYSTAGRRESANEARTIDIQIKDALNSFGEKFLPLTRNEGSIDALSSMLRQCLTSPKD